MPSLVPRCCLVSLVRLPEDLEVRVQMRLISHQEVILGEAGKRVGEDDGDVVGSLAICDLRQRTSPSPGLQESSGV